MLEPLIEAEIPGTAETGAGLQAPERVRTRAVLSRKRNFSFHLCDRTCRERDAARSNVRSYRLLRVHRASAGSSRLTVGPSVVNGIIGLDRTKVASISVVVVV